VNNSCLKREEKERLTAVKERKKGGTVKFKIQPENNIKEKK